MNTENMIEITGADLVETVKAVYDLSRPQGLGFLHFEEGGLTDMEAKEILGMPDYGIDKRKCIIQMDYVKGRSCKFNVFKDENGRLFIRDSWYDHTDEDLQELLKRIGKV